MPWWPGWRLPIRTGFYRENFDALAHGLLEAAAGL